MFNAKVKSEVLKGIIDVTSPLVNEVKLNITPKGISLRAVDPAHVAMVDLHVNSKAFEEYKADEMELGIDMDKLGGIMRLSSSGDMVLLEYDEESNRLIVKIGIVSNQNKTIVILRCHVSSKRVGGSGTLDFVLSRPQRNLLLNVLK